MAASTFETARDAYWKAVGLAGPLPELPEEPFDAFVELLHLTSEAKGAFKLLDLVDDPYPGLAVGDSRKPWQLLWAVQLAELEPFLLPSEPELLFLADSVPDPKGKHRVYTYVDGVRGMLEFPDVAHALAWMAVRVQRARDELGAAELDQATDVHAVPLDDPHEDTASSGFFVFETLIDAPFAEAWDAYSRGEWPVMDQPIEPFRLQKKDGWQRRLSLYLVQRFLERRLVDFPKSIKPTELHSAHRMLAKQLAAFEESIHTGLVPEVIDDVAVAPDPVLANLAKAWTERHDRWRRSVDADDVSLDEEAAPAKAAPASETKAKPAKKAKGKAAAEPEETAEAGGTKAAAKKAPAKKMPAKKVAAKKPKDDELDDELDDLDDDELEDERPARPAAPDPNDAPFLRKLRVALTEILATMERDELLELDEGKRPALLAELVASAAEARSPQHLLRQISTTLVHSENIEEVYASDEEIEHYLKKKLAG